MYKFRTRSSVGDNRSIFDDDNNDVLKAITFFNGLSNEDKAQIVSNLHPTTFKLKQYVKRLFPLLSKIQHDISKHDEIKIGTKLMEYGLDETYARLFVVNIKKQAPTLEYQIDQINKIPDDEFCTKLPDVMKCIWVYNENVNAEMVTKFGISIEKLHCIEHLTFQMLNKLARGDIVEKLIEESMKQLSKKKLDVMMNQIKVHKTHWHDTTMFKDVQDTYLQTEKIAQQNAILNKLLQELITLKRNEQSRLRR